MFAKYLIVGNGVAGINAAKTLSQGGADGQIAVCAAEQHHYYNRWQLPALLAGTKSLEEIYFYPDDWYTKNGIIVHLGARVDAVSAEDHQVTLADGREIAYGSLLIATGGHAFIPPIQGADKRGVFVLRTLDDVLAIRDHAERARRAIVIGGGLLGLEAAHSLKHFGLDVTVVEYFPRLLPRQLDAPGSAMFQDLIENCNIKAITNAATAQVLGDGKATGIQLINGRILEGDLVVISAGVRCNIEVARQASLDVDRGIIVNEWMETSAPDIYAAGDCAESQGRIYGIIPAAIEQARIAALRMMGADVSPYRGTMPSTTLKVANIDLTCIGEANAEEGCTSIRYEDKVRGTYRKLVLRDSRIVGAILLGDKANVVPITRLIKSQTDLSAYEQHLADADFDFRAILAPPKEPKATRYECTICGYIYDPRKGDQENDIPPDTPFEKLPKGWVCPMCGAEADVFTRLAD